MNRRQPGHSGSGDQERPGHWTVEENHHRLLRVNLQKTAEGPKVGQIEALVRGHLTCLTAHTVLK